MSDVFVVPNLNVMYRNVQVVHWENEKCAVEEIDGALPETTTINLEDVKNQPALAFYSRYHVEYVKLPELEDSVQNLNNTITACNCTEKEIMCSFGGKEEMCSKLDQQVSYLNKAIIDWNEYLQPKEDFGDNTIVNWFDEVGSKIMKDKNDVDITDHSSALAPPTLLSGAESVEDTEKKTKLEEIKRIQFSGGGSTFSMTLSKEKIWDKVVLSCWEGCNKEYDNTIEGPGLDHLEVLFMGIGPMTKFNILNLKTHVIHESTKDDTDAESTSIGFTLGDDDPGDEFVVDLYYDEKFGTVIFNSIAGRSKCPHEAGTAAIEDPRLVITSYPSQNVFPDEDMVFELEMSNFGVGDESQFVLYAQHRDNEGSLTLLLDGASFDGREFTNILKDTSYKKTLVVQRGPRMFQYPKLDLVMESSCEDSSSQ